MSRQYFEEQAISRYDLLENEFINLALNRFTWEGDLPYGLTSEQLEWLLIEKGQLMGYMDELKGLMILPCFGEKDINPYGLPTVYKTMSENGKINDSVDFEEGVLLRNNPLGSPDIEIIRSYAKKIDDVEMTMEVNLFQQSIPRIILADEDSKLSAKKLIQQIREFKFAIFGKSTLSNNIKSSDVLDTQAPYILDKLQDFKTALRNELLTYLGINNNNNIKKERMIVDEVNANNEYTNINLDLMYDMRKKFCDEINSKFNINISVKKREVEDGSININTGNDDRGRI